MRFIGGRIAQALFNARHTIIQNPDYMQLCLADHAVLRCQSCRRDHAQNRLVTDRPYVRGGS